MNEQTAVLQETMKGFEAELNRQGRTLSEMSSSLQVLVRLEQSHSHILDQLKSGSITMTGHEKRIQDLETKMPPLLEMRRWVVGGILAGIGMMGIALVKLVVVDTKSASLPQIIYVTPTVTTK